MKRWTWVIALVVLALLVSGCDLVQPDDETGGSEDMVRVSRVVDGDTVELADGRKVRYLGINTPERGQPFYQEATDFNAELVAGKKVRLEFDVDTIDKYGRTLAHVFVGLFLPSLATILLMASGPFYLIWFPLLGRDLLRLGRGVPQE